jgi:hypothetical protein
MRPIPDWLVVESVTDTELGVVTSGKEAQIDLVERFGHDGRSCLVARKRYLPREVHNKGELESLGFQRASTFRHDVRYREGRQFRKSRDRRAVEQMTTYGKHLLQDRWTGHEYEVMSTLWNAGLTVPYPIGYSTDVLELESSATATAPPPSCDPPASTPVGSPTRTTNSSTVSWRSSPPGSRTAICRPTTCCGGTTGCGSSTSRKPSTSPPTRWVSIFSIETSRMCATGSGVVAW